VSDLKGETPAKAQQYEHYVYMWYEGCGEGDEGREMVPGISHALAIRSSITTRLMPSPIFCVSKPD
jgi:hypothetical protein